MYGHNERQVSLGRIIKKKKGSLADYKIKISTLLMKNTTHILGKPLISVIMNCKNGQKYLKQAINSIKTQTYTNWELIFFDNNSNDKSKKILLSYLDKRIKYFFSNKSLNLYQARNQAIKKAKGKYIAFLDVDDLWVKDKLAIQVNFLEKNTQYSMIYSNYFNLINKKKFLKYKKNLASGSITKKLLKNYTVGILTILIKKNIFKKFKFNNNFNIIGDYDFIIRISQKLKIGYINKPLSLYRIHKNNMSKKKLKIYIYELKNWLKKNKRLLVKYNYYFYLKFQYLILKLKIKDFINCC